MTPGDMLVLAWAILASLRARAAQIPDTQQEK